MTTAIKVSKKLMAIERKLSTINGENRIDRVKRVLDYQFPTDSTGKETERQMKPEEINGLSDYMNKGKKIRPSKPTDMDYQKIIMASLEDLKSNLMEAKIAIAHNHHIEWKKAKLIEGEKLSELETEYEK